MDLFAQVTLRGKVALHNKLPVQFSAAVRSKAKNKNNNKHFVRLESIQKY